MPTTIISITPTLADGVAIETNGHYKAGTVITIAVEFSDTVVVDTAGGEPYLELNTLDIDTGNNRTATYASGSGSSTLTFEYTIQNGDDTGQLAYKSTSALNLNGSTIQNGAEDADLTLASPGETGSLSANTSIVVDTEAPTLDFNPGSDLPAEGDTFPNLLDSGDVSTLSQSGDNFMLFDAENNVTLLLSEADLTTRLESEPYAYKQAFYDYLFFLGEQSDNHTTSDDLVLTQTGGAASNSLFPIGEHINTFTLTDKAGNSATDTITITVSDNIAPTVVANETYRVNLDEDGNATVNVMDLDNGSTDNDLRGIADYKILTNLGNFEQEEENLSFTEADLNTDVEVALRLYDPSGLTSEQAITLQIRDGIAPIAIAQTGLTLSLDETGTASLTAEDFNDGSSDNRNAIDSKAIASNRDTVEGNDSATLTFDYDDIGAHSVTLSVTDSSGNTGMATETVTIVDSIVPTAIAQDFTLQLGSDGTATLLTTDIDNGSSDNTPIEGLTLSLDRTEFTAADVGQDFTVTLTVEDEAGNSDTDTATVSVEDTLAPNVVPKNIELILDGDGNGTLSFGDVDDGSDDNVAIASNGTTLTYSGTTATELNFGLGDLGLQEITLNVTDTSGNTNTGTAQVTVKESTDPTIIVYQDITARLDKNGNATISLNDIDNGSVDYGNVAQDPGSGIDTRELQWTSSSGLITGSELSFTGDDLGDQTVTLVITDKDGNSTSVDATVTVADEIAPVLSGVPDNVTVEADMIPAVATVTATDNVDDDITVIYSELRTDGDSPNNYTLTRTWTATDNQGNIASESQVISVDDTTAPTVVTQDITVELEASGSISITADEIDNNSSDSVGAVTLSIDIDTFTGDDLGANTVTLRVEDEDGNSATGTATVTVEDNIAPEAIAQAYTVELDEFGVGSLTGTDIDGGSTDNDQIASIDALQTTFSLTDLGSNSVVLRVSDRAGNTDTATAIVTVVDKIAPEVITQSSVTLELDENGDATLTLDDVDNGSNDIAGILTRTLSQTAFNASHLGLNNQVTLSVTDTNGNTATGTTIVLVEDNLAPVLSGVPADSSVEANEVPDAADVTALDNVDGAVTVSFSETRVDGANPNAYTLTRTWTATDSRGNSISENQEISVGDTVLPTVVVQDIIVDLDENGDVTITADQIDDGSSDALGIASLELDQTIFNQVGEFTVTLTVTDNSGNKASDTAQVTVQDSLAPVLSADPEDVTVEADAVPQPITITAEDNVDGGVAVSFEETRTNGTSPNNYTLTRTWSATDSSDNEATVTQLVIVDDTTAPIVNVQDITVQLDENGQATIVASDIDNGSFDTVSDVSLSLDITAFDGDDLGNNTVTLTVTDEDSNSATGTVTVTVEDTIAPELFSVPNDISLEADAIPDLATVTATITATDNVDGTVTVTDTEVRTDGNSPNSYTLTRTWTATDSQGNSTSASQVISVGDTVAPTVITQDVTLALEENGTVSLTAEQVDNGSFDTVSDVTLSLDITSFDVNNLGSNNTVTLTVTDTDNNSATGTATITIEDNLAPTAIAQDLTINLEGGSATLTAEAVDNGSSDNTGDITLSLDQTSFISEGDYTVTLTVTDTAGNRSTDTANIRVESNIPPVAVAQDITIELDENGEVTLDPEDVDGGSTDNIAIVSSRITQTLFTADHLGDNQVTLTVTDAQDNSDSAIATVTVIDALAPVVQTQNIELALNVLGTASLTAADIDAGSTDNVAIASSTLDITQFDADDLNTPTTVTLTVTDTSGNSASETAVVTIVDQINPIASAQNITLSLDANGVATLTAEELDGGSADNVAIASLTIDQDSFSLDNLGANTVTLTATDTSGNQTTDTATVTVVDVLSPTVVTQNATIFLDETGIATLTIADVDGGSTDNGDIIAMRLSQTRFTTADLNQTKSVTLTLTDQSGNTASAIAQVTIADNLAPTVVTQDVILYLDENNQATLSPSQVENGSSDNVQITALDLDRTEFTADDLGVQTVILTVTDSSGNSSTGTAQVTVQESGPPTPLLGQVFTLAENTPGETFVGSVLGQTTLGTLQNWRIEAPDVDQDSVPVVRIDANTGVLRVTDADDLDFETNPTLTAFVTVSNGIEDSEPTAITLALTDQNEVASLTLSNLYPRLSESLDTSTALKVADIAIADDGLGSNQLAIAGTDPELFEINGSALYLKAGINLDFDAKPLYSALVTVDDITLGNTPDDAVLFAIALDPDTGLISGTTDVDTISASDSTSDNTPSASASVTSDDANGTTSANGTTDGTVDSTTGSTTDGTLQPKDADSDSSSSSDINGSDRDDVLNGTKVNDRLFGFGGNDRIKGKKGNDKLKGGDGDDTLIGQGQRDRLIGGSGDDTLIGGRDKDKLSGGTGSDTFVYKNKKDGRDVITDFTIGEDRLDLSRLVRRIKGVAEADLLGSGVLLQQKGKHTILQIDLDGATGAKQPIDLIKLKGINATNLSTNDFIF